MRSSSNFFSKVRSILHRNIFLMTFTQHFPYKNQLLYVKKEMKVLCDLLFTAFNSFQNAPGYAGEKKYIPDVKIGILAFGYKQITLVLFSL
ncbi:hypothetical protein GDO81_008613 [Engystomops pustulosus]|uniref:Uncharacterized protein n=1 Tax=Engystomops pustulosus TaxID=76066 RepID=A0AAV7CGM7_ENGPU|nr:hypothetical protein GDO81_008613 [Engystomops pustulosus]